MNGVVATAGGGVLADPLDRKDEAKEHAILSSMSKGSKQLWAHYVDLWERLDCWEALLAAAESSF